MSGTIIASIISVGGSLLVCIANILYNKRNSRIQKEALQESLQNELLKQNRELTTRYITDKRVDWICEVRNTVSEYLAYAMPVNGVFFKSLIKKIFLSKPDVNDITDTFNKVFYLRNKIKLLLNPQGEIDKKVLKHLEDSIKYFGDLYSVVSGMPSHNKRKEAENRLTKSLYDLLFEVEIYLKTEWNRVKKETQDGIGSYTEDDQKADYKNIAMKAKQIEKEIYTY